MIEQKKCVIDGMEFTVQQFPARTCLKLEKRTIAILAPILNILDSEKKVPTKKKVSAVNPLDAEINFPKMATAIQEILTSLDDASFDLYISDMMKNVFVIENGQPVQLTMEKFDHLFVGKSIVVYKLLVEIMRINCFALFELMGGGWSKITNTLGNQTK